MSWIDGQAMVTGRTAEGEAVVSHSFAAKSNLDSALESLKRALPDVIGQEDHREFVMDSIKDGSFGDDINFGSVVFGVPFWVAFGAVEAVVMTVLAAKDVVDAAVHGILAGFQD